MASALAPAGGDQPHNNLQPYLTFYFCIALQGVFPPRVDGRHGTDRRASISRSGAVTPDDDPFLLAGLREHAQRRARRRWRGPTRKRPRSSRCSSARRRVLPRALPEHGFDVIVSSTSQSDGSTSPAEDEIRIVDIALLPEFCNRGIGTTLLRGLQSEAAAAGKPLRIHVERFNPAMRLYERLGFRPVADRGFICSWSGGRRSLPANQPPLKLRRSAEALAKAEAGSHEAAHAWSAGSAPRTSFHSSLSGFSRKAGAGSRKDRLVDHPFATADG